MPPGQHQVGRQLSREPCPSTSDVGVYTATNAFYDLYRVCHLSETLSSDFLLSPEEEAQVGTSFGMNIIYLLLKVGYTSTILAILAEFSVLQQ